MTTNLKEIYSVPDCKKIAIVAVFESGGVELLAEFPRKKEKQAGEFIEKCKELLMKGKV